VVIGDMDFSTVRLNREDDVFERIRESYGAIARKAGGDPEIGPSLPAMLERHGLREVEAESFVRYQPGGGLIATVLGLTYKRLHQRALDYGVSAADLDHFYAVLDDPSVGIASPAMWYVRGKR
jgi:hypothetical protein